MLHGKECEELARRTRTPMEQKIVDDYVDQLRRDDEYKRSGEWLDDKFRK